MQSWKAAGEVQPGLHCRLSLRRGYLTSFCKANTVCMRLSLYKYSQKGKREELKVLRDSAEYRINDQKEASDILIRNLLPTI